MSPAAIVSDVHGNIEALDAVLADLDRRGIGPVACLGDFVGYGAAPNECIDRLKPRIEVAVAGNHDLAATGRIRLGYFNPDAAKAARWTGETLRPEHRDWLHALPMSVAWRGARLVHASPAEPEEWNYVLTPNDAAIEMAASPEPICFVGHSHRAATFAIANSRVALHMEERVAQRPDTRYLVNVGSVGQPRDGDPRACYLVWDDEGFEHVRVAYDVERARDRIRQAGLPRFLGDRLQWGE